MSQILNTLSGNMVHFTFGIWGDLFMHQKPPFIDGKKIDEQYDLDNETHLLQLGLNPKAELKIADKYAHYTHCKHAVIELKSSSTVSKGIKQIESTIKRLLKRGKKVDFAIIVVKKINTYEKHFFTQGKGNILLNPKTKVAHRIRIGSLSWEVLIFRESEVNRMYEGLPKYLSEGN